MNCLIVDDELLARELVEDNVRKIPFLNHVASCRNAGDALKVIRSQQVDLIFLDIKMPGINGLELIEGMQQQRPMVILITAFENYALEAFKLNVVDYLVKPVTFSRFLAAVGKAHDLFTLRQRPAAPDTQAENHFFVNAGYALMKIRMSDIAYIEGLKDYVKIHLTTGKPVVTRINLKDLTERLPSNEFMRIHRSYIIALDKIESVQKHQLIILDTEIPIGESFRDALLGYIEERNF